jgi:hypothetical protein
MSSIGAIGGSSAVQAALVRSADTDTEKAALLLKKSVQGDKDLVNTLLPPASAGGDSGLLDIKA